MYVVIQTSIKLKKKMMIKMLFRVSKIFKNKNMLIDLGIKSVVRQNNRLV